MAMPLNCFFLKRFEIFEKNFSIIFTGSDVSKQRERKRKLTVRELYQ